MTRSQYRWRRQQGAALFELMISTTVALGVLGGLIGGAMVVRKSIAATEQYSVSTANESRLIDYVARDLRRAVRVGMLTGATRTVLKNYDNFSVNAASTLTISLPDYYADNTPDNTLGSNFKTSRYRRATLNTSSTYNGSGTALLNGVVPWTDAVMTVGGKRVTRFAPTSAGTGEIEVRYYRAARSSSDGTVCYFRAEYPSGASSPSQIREIAERVSDNASTTSLLVTGKNNGQVFRLQSNFNPRYRFTGSSTVGTEVFVEVSTRNPRRD